MRYINYIIKEEIERLLNEGVFWTNNNGVPDLEINQSPKDFNNKGVMTVDTRVFGNRNNILYGDGTSHWKVKSINDLRLTRQALISTYLNLIDYIENGRNGVIFTDKNLDSKTKTSIEKMLKQDDDETILLKAKSAIERSQNISQIANNTYDRVNAYQISGNKNKIPRYNVLQVPYTNVKCIALFSMTDFNFSDAIKHGTIRRTDKTDKVLGVDSNDEIERTIPITYDGNIKPNIAQNFSLRGFDVDNLNSNKDHFRQNYQYQGGKYNTSEMGYDDLERELRKEKKYSTVNQFLDKSIIYAKYALKKENFIPDFIVTVPSSSNFNKYYAYNLSNKIGCKYIPDFFRKNLINVKWGGKYVYDEMVENGFSETEILKFENEVRGIAYRQISNEIEKVIDNLMKPYYHILNNIYVKRRVGLVKSDFEDVMHCLYKYVYSSLTFNNKYGDDVFNHLVENFANQKVNMNDNPLFKRLVAVIATEIGNDNFQEVLVNVADIVAKYSNKLKENGYKLRFGVKDFKVTNFQKKFRPYLQDIYVIADGFLNNETKMLVQSISNGKVLIFDEDINSGASLKLCIDAFMQKVPNGNTHNLLCLTNAYSDKGL